MFRRLYRKALKLKPVVTGKIWKRVTYCVNMRMQAAQKYESLKVKNEVT